MVDLFWYAVPAAWFYGLATLGFGTFTVLLAIGQRGRGRGALLLAMLALTTAWAGTSAWIAVGGSSAAWQVAHVFDSLRIGAGLAFLLLLLNREQRIVGFPGELRGSIRLWFLGLILLVAATIGFGDMGVGEGGAGARGATISYSLLLLRSVLGLVLVEQLLRRTDPVLRWNVKPLCLGFGGIFFYDLVFYSDALLFRTLDPNIWAGRGLANALVIPLLGVAAARNREWDFSLTVSRHVLAGSTALLASGVFLLVLAGVGYYIRYFGGSWGRTVEFVLVFAGMLALGLLVLSGTLRSKLRVFIGKNFFVYRYDYREEWLKFVRAFSASSTQTTHEQCIQALADLVESPGGALWLQRDCEGLGQTARLNMPALAEVELRDGPLANFLARTGWVVDVAQARDRPEDYQNLRLPEWIGRLPSAWLIVPLCSGDEFVGFVVLARPRVRVEVNWEVRDILKTGARQAASYVALLQATEALLEAKKFDAFNRMSAFVVHDLKNLIAQLQLMLRNAERHRGNPEFQRDMLATVEHAVGRMNHLMLQLRSGAVPIESPRPVDLGEVARKVQSLRSDRTSAFCGELAPGVLVLGHEDRLERVIGHLVQNALEAVRDNPRVTLRVFQEGTDGVVEVRDNGVGMAPEFVRNRLFKPFQTTKTMGMGIGTYESQQYVNGLGGRINVESEQSVGSTVRVHLPLAGAERTRAGAGAV